MDGSPLQRIPAELRVQIYEWVLKQQTPVFVANEAQRRIRYGSRLPANTLAITQTCKEMRREIAQLFFTCNDFSVTGPQVTAFRRVEGAEKCGDHPFVDLVATIGPPNARVVHGVKVMLGEVLAGPMMRGWCLQWGGEIGSYLAWLREEVPDVLSKRDIVAPVELNAWSVVHQSSGDRNPILLPLDRHLAAEALLKFAEVTEQETGANDGASSFSNFGQAAKELRKMACTVRRVKFTERDAE
ncbi:hypothetical protein LTR56_012728 [Elasticomyces elasticus]|nr:hypothetical protein LTR22_022987 [Elasticomyces elasticus]KAK3639005.1 hypothetical protein LTR56_012728 [Elasticomyces elasticus]KAK4918741.1 hypothetical protein LTR49_013528 [Elasticomyces elasticus]KAK5754430.1 hypothetical protein LTS12_015499 [Elasticomyces elasticus]